MSVGSSLVAFKRALRTSLQGRVGLAGVLVTYEPEPEQAESIWFGNARTTDERIPVMKAGTKKVDERYLLDIHVQVIQADGQTQESADLRCVALFGELQQALAVDPQITAEVFVVELDSWEHFVGELPSGRGHGSRFDARVRVHARLYPS